jgi:hypothetical protein
MKVKMTGQKLFSLVCIAQLWLSPCANAIELWKEKKNSASSFELKHDYQRAADLYQAALKLLPANEENAKAKIESAIALDLIALKQYDKAFSFGEDAAHIARTLRTQHRLDPDVLLSMQYLFEACESASAELSGPYERRHTLEQQFTKLKLILSKALNPNDPKIIDQQIAYARTFVALRNDARAEKEMSQILNELSPKSKRYKDVQLAIAGLQEKHGHTSKFASEYLRRHNSKTEAMRAVADGKFWAGDYAGARAMLKLAMGTLSGTRAEKIFNEVRINQLYASMCIDHADWKGAEPYYRRNVALSAKDPLTKPAMDSAKFQLANCLTQQNRLKEAAVLQPRNKRDLRYMERYNFILTDEEKAALAKQQAKRGNSAK